MAALIGIAAGTLGIGVELVGATAEGSAFASALIMILALLGSPAAALGATLVLSIHSLVALEAWQPIAPLVASVLAAELLRKGFRPLFALGLQFLTITAAAGLSRESQVAYLDVCATSLLCASASVVLALIALLLIPRRSSLFPPHCRIRWDHGVTALVVGWASLCTMSLLPDGPAAMSSVPAGRVLGLMLFAHGLSLAFSRWLEFVTRKSGRGLLQRLRSEKRKQSCSFGWVPHEVSAELLRANREARRIARCIVPLKTLLSRTTANLEKQQRLLADTRRALRDRSNTLARVLRKHKQLSAQLTAVLDHAPDPIVLVDQHKRIERASPAIARLIGYESSALVGQPLGLLTPPTQIDTHPFDLNDENLGPSRPATQQARIASVQRADGGERKLAIGIHEYSVSNSRNYLIYLRNPNQMKQALAALSRARAALKKAHESRRALIGSMSHEFRTPLHGLIATLDMLRDETLSPEGRQKLAIARTSARSLLRLANDVLDWSRFESGSFTFDHKLFDLHALMSQVIEESAPRAAGKNLQLKFEVLGELPPAFKGDPHRIKQVLGNLVTNAVKFTTSGEVRLTARYARGTCTLDVSDTGPGIAPDMLEAIFQPFVQARTSGQRQEGAGLGLAICRQLCEAMGGKLYVLSSSFAGSTFRTMLPLEASDEAPEQEQSLRIFRNPQGRILVVEDHPANQYVVKSMLEALKCNAAMASSGAEALELLSREKFDLILMDCRMPGMDGIETTRRIRAELKQPVPIIAMTANNMPEDVERCMQSGMDDFLAKPFGRAVLHDMLCKWLKPQTPPTDSGSWTQRLARVPVVDREIFKELWENLQWRKPPMRRICETFLATTRDTLRLLDGSDHGALGRNLHTLLGTAGMIGARQIEQLAGLLQEANKSRNTDDLASLRKRLAAAVVTFEREFTRKLDADPSTSYEVR